MPEGVPFEGRPTTQRDNTFCCDRGFSLRIDKDEVSIVAFTQEASLLDSKEFGWSMSHFVDNQLLGKDAFVRHIKHGDECVLSEWSTTGGCEAVPFLLREEVWCMVGRNDIDEVCAYGFTECLAVT